MRCKQEEISQRKTGEFMCFIRDQTEHAVKVRVPGFVLENMPKRSYRPPPRRAPTPKTPPKPPQDDEDYAVPSTKY